MRAVQSSSTAGFSRSSVEGRTEQFAALRYVSRCLADAAAGRSLESGALDVGASDSTACQGPANSPFKEESACWRGIDWGESWIVSESVATEMSTAVLEAGALLEAMRFCNSRLADETISFAEWQRNTVESRVASGAKLRPDGAVSACCSGP